MPDVLAKMAVDISADASGLSRGLDAARGKLNSFSSSLSGISGALGGVLAGLSIVSIGKQIIDVTSNFQRFEAVLTNTLGSGSEAQQALALIKDFAVKTPFSVEKLTGAFVKLANQGFVPTRDEMRKLGDLASSTGKDFDQLAEAIIDAQTGQFERLKEFGIKASKQGDQVKFSFKGVQTQVGFTSSEIQKYILSLGDLKGVSGAMAAISETLGGKISNLGDAFDNLLLALGKLTGGPLNAAIQGLTTLVNVMTIFGGGDADPSGTLETMIKFLNSGNLSAENYAMALKETEKQAALLGVGLIKLTDDVSGLTKVLIDPRTKIKVITPVEAQEQIETIDTLQAKVKELIALRVATPTSDIGKITDFNVQIEGINNQIKALEDLGKADKEVKKVTKAFKDLTGMYLLLPDLSKLSNPLSKVTKTSGPLTFTVDLTASEAALDRFDKRIDQTVNNVQKKLPDMGKTIEVSLTGPITSAIDGLAEALGNAAAGVGNFGEDILKIVANFGAQLGKMLIAEGVALLAVKLGLKNPFTMIAAGAALVAITSALSAGISKAHSSTIGGGGSAGGGVSRSTPIANDFGQSVSFNARFEIEGTKLVAVMKTTEKQQGRLKAG